MKVTRDNIERLGRVCIAYHEYLTEYESMPTLNSTPTPSDRPSFEDIIMAAVRDHKTVVIREGISEVRASARALRGIPEAQRFFDFMMNRLGAPLEALIGDTDVYLKNLMKRGKIVSEEEARFVLSILNEEEKGTVDEAATQELNRMMADYESDNTHRREEK